MGDESCSVCDFPFTDEEWEHRHTAPDGSDIHERCCPCGWRPEGPGSTSAIDVGLGVLIGAAVVAAIVVVWEWWR